MPRRDKVPYSYIRRIAIEDLTGVSAGPLRPIAQRETYLVLGVAPVPDGKRTVESTVFARFPDPQSARAAANRLHQGLASTLRDALAAVADPDLDPGDRGVDVIGDRDQLPSSVVWATLDMRFQERRMAWRGVAPRDLSDATMRWLAREAEAPNYTEASLDHYFAVRRGGVTLRIIHDNGWIHSPGYRNVNYASARVAALFAGATGESMTVEEARSLWHTVMFAPVPVSYRPDGTELLLPRPGLTLTTRGMKTRLAYFEALDALGAAEDERPWPDGDDAAEALVEALRTQLREAEAAGTLRATRRQIGEANRISSWTVGPHDRFALGASRAEVEAFIAKYEPHAKFPGVETTPEQFRAKKRQTLEALRDGPLDAEAIAAALGQYHGAFSVRWTLMGTNPSPLDLGHVECLEPEDPAEPVRYRLTEAGRRYLDE